MAAPIRPDDSKAFGREKWIFVPTIASTAAPTVAELTAAGALDVSMMMFEDSGRPERSVTRPSRPMRVADTIIYEQIGTESVTGGTMLFAFDPQAAAASNGKKAWEKFVAGTTGYLVRRSGLAAATDIATGQFATMFPVEFSSQFETTVGDGESKVNAFTVEVAVNGPVVFNKAVV